MGITAVVAAVGLSVAGTATSVIGAQHAASANEEIARQEQRAEAVRKQAMELDARRKQLEAVRNQQRARSMSLANATAQGAGQGSGLQGGYGQIGGETGNNLLGITQNLGFGEQLFGINSQISQQKMGLAQAQGISSIGGGLSSLGGALLSASGPIGNLSKGFGGSSPKPFTPWGGSSRYGF